MTLMSLWLATTLFVGGEDRGEDIKPPPGSYTTSWVGNSLPGDGGPNGLGFWVQNGADEIEVTPDGTVLAGTEWDEAGRASASTRKARSTASSSSRPGRASRRRPGAGTPPMGPSPSTARTSTSRTRASGSFASPGGPGDLDSAAFADERELPAVAVGLHARAGRLVVAYADRLEMRDGRDCAVSRTVAVAGLRDVTLAPDGTPWVIAGDVAGKLGEDDRGTIVAICREVARRRPSRSAMTVDSSSATTGRTSRSSSST